MTSWCRLFVLLASSLLMVGCPTLTPTRYYQFDFQLEIDRKPTDISYSWHCTEVLDGPNFGPGPPLTARWDVSPRTQVVLKRLTNDSVFFFRPARYCGEE